MIKVNKISEVQDKEGNSVDRTNLYHLPSLFIHKLETLSVVNYTSE